MNNVLAQMTKDEFRELVETAVDQKLLEMLGDPDSPDQSITARLFFSESKNPRGTIGCVGVVSNRDFFITLP